MSSGLFPYKKALQVFGTSAERLRELDFDESTLPEFARSAADNRQLKSWSLREMPEVGSRIGFLSRPKTPLALSIFVTKGGVLKSSLTLNLARLAALNGIRTCVVGLDMQGDISTALSVDDLPDDSLSFEDALKKMNGLRGLADVFTGEVRLDDVILPTDLPSLSYIPETPELVALDQSLIHRNRREYWLKESIVAPLKTRFDLILMDCSPNWNRLITNSLVACDGLISPLECKINNFRNFKTFQVLLSEFKRDMQAEFRHLYVPTRLSNQRKLSREICSWYQTHLPDCTRTAIRESVPGEESIAMRCSVAEFAPASEAASEMRCLTQEIWTTFAGAQEEACLSV